MKRRAFNLAHYEVRFENLFSVPILRENYNEYLKRSYQQEPLLFLLAVREFKQNPNIETAITIVDTYIKDTGNLQVNMDGASKDKIINQTNEKSEISTLFDEAYKLVTHYFITNSSTDSCTWS
jgi:hypothetical protein